MTNDTTQPDWTPRIVATLATVLALVGGALLVVGAVRTAPAVSATTTCAGFAADAFKSFNNGANVTLSAPFAPGDHVHLALDIKGAGYSWKTTGVLGAAKTDVTGSGWFETDTTFVGKLARSDSAEHAADTTPDPAASDPSNSTGPSTAKYKESTTSGVARGSRDGITRLDIDAEVATAGDGAITISQRGSLLLAVSQSVAVASCTVAKQAPAPSSGDVSSSGSTRSLSAPLG